MNNFRMAKIIIVFSSLSYLSVSFLRNYNSPENIEKDVFLNSKKILKIICKHLMKNVIKF